MYPGARVDAAGNATDWPGWKFENPRWVVDPIDAHLRRGFDSPQLHRAENGHLPGVSQVVRLSVRRTGDDVTAPLTWGLQIGALGGISGDRTPVHRERPRSASTFTVEGVKRAWEYGRSKRITPIAETRDSSTLSAARDDGWHRVGAVDEWGIGSVEAGGEAERRRRGPAASCGPGRGRLARLAGCRRSVDRRRRGVHRGRACSCLVSIGRSRWRRSSRRCRGSGSAQWLRTGGRLSASKVIV